MKNLIKYEFRKTLAIKLAILGLTAAAEIAFLLGLALNRERLIAISIVFLVMLAFGGIMVIGLATILILHRDMNTKQSHMLFMTPNSCYKILGAKVAENALSLVISGACFFALGALDITLVFARHGELDELWKTITSVLKSFNEHLTLDIPTMLTFTVGILGSWFATVTAACLADVVSAALLNGKRGNGFIAFLLFIVLSIAVSWIQNTCTGSISSIRAVFLVQAGIALVLSAGMIFATARIMETRLSV